MTADLIYVVMSDVKDRTVEAKFNDWYNTEHVPELLAVPGFIAGRRFRAMSDSPKYLAVYDLAEIDVLDRYAFLRIRPTIRIPRPPAKRCGLM